MKILIIHPKDKSTDFLCPIYENLPQATVIRKQLNEDVTVIDTELQKDYDKVIFLGHGSPVGLLDMINNIYLIYPSHTMLLKNKTVIAIWCNADKYFRGTGINRFNTGMFISEMREADYYGISTTQKEIDQSNNLFVNIIKKNILYTPKTIRKHVDKEYIGNNSIIQANREFMGLK